MRGLMVLMVGMLVIPNAMAATPGVVGQLEQSDATTSKEKLDFAHSATEEMAAAVKAVEKLLEQEDKNEEVKDCLKRKLTPMQALLDISNESSKTMQAALAASDDVHAEQEFRKIAVALSKTREFLAEAQACVGSAGGDKAKTISTITQTVDDMADASDIDEGPSINDPQPDFGTQH